MIILNLTPDGTGKDLADGKSDVIQINNITVTAVDRGMKSGKTCLMLRVDLPGGKVLISQNSLKLWNEVLAAINARYPDG